MMEKLRNWLESKFFQLKTGIPIEVANGGRPIEQVVIRYKNYFFMVDLDAESGRPTGDFSWSEGTPMTHVPIREHYTAVRKDSAGLGV